VGYTAKLVSKKGKKIYDNTTKEGGEWMSTILILHRKESLHLYMKIKHGMLNRVATFFQKQIFLKRKNTTK
jgi:hypothetical protein